MDEVIEEWRISVPNYEVSNLGQFRRSTPGRRTYVGRLSTPIPGRKGYLVVNPTVDGRNVQHYIHDLVAAAFLGSKPVGADINHIDGDKTNNRVENLEYVTHRENMEHAARTGLMVRGEGHPGHRFSEEDIARIRSLHSHGHGVSSLARRRGPGGPQGGRRGAQGLLLRPGRPQPPGRRGRVEGPARVVRMMTTIREVGKLPLEQQEQALAIIRRRVPAPPPRKEGLWCGHPESAVRVDSNGVSFCAECSR